MFKEVKSGSPQIAKKPTQLRYHMRQIPDLMLCLQELTEGTMRRIRKTAEDPPRVSVIDTIVVITGQSQANSGHTWQRLSQSYPDVCQSVTNFKFSGQGQ